MTVVVAVRLALVPGGEQKHERHEPHREKQRSDDLGEGHESRFHGSGRTLARNARSGESAPPGDEHSSQNRRIQKVPAACTPSASRPSDQGESVNESRPARGAGRSS